MPQHTHRGYTYKEREKVTLPLPETIAVIAATEPLFSPRKTDQTTCMQALLSKECVESWEEERR
jgi:hypothetical protein